MMDATRWFIKVQIQVPPTIVGYKAMVPAISPTKRASQIPVPREPSKVVSRGGIPHPEREGGVIKGADDAL